MANKALGLTLGLAGLATVLCSQSLDWNNKVDQWGYSTYMQAPACAYNLRSPPSEQLGGLGLLVLAGSVIGLAYNSFKEEDSQCNNRTPPDPPAAPPAP